MNHKIKNLSSGSTEDRFFYFWTLKQKQWVNLPCKITPTLFCNRKYVFYKNFLK